MRLASPADDYDDNDADDVLASAKGKSKVKESSGVWRSRRYSRSIW